MAANRDKMAKREALREARETAKLRNAFKVYDVDNSGKLSAEEFLNMLTYSSSAEGGAKGLSLEDAQAVMADFDTDGDNALDIDELLTAWRDINDSDAVKEAREKRKADAVLYDEIMELDSKYLEKHMKMLTNIAADLRGSDGTDGALASELELMDKLISVVGAEEGISAAFKAMSADIVALEENNEAALGGLLADMSRADAYKKKYEEMIAKMLEELGKTGNWFMTPPVVHKRKVLERFDKMYVHGDAEEYSDQQARAIEMSMYERLQKNRMFEALYDTNFDGQMPEETVTDALAAEFAVGYAYDAEEYYANQEEEYFLMGIDVPDFLKRENEPTQEQLIAMGKANTWGR